MEPIASPTTSRQKILFWSGLTLAAITAINSNNELILDLVWLLFAITITIGPHCHKLKPKTAALASIPGILLTLDGILELIPATSNTIIGPLWLSEYVFLLAYLALAIGLIKLPRPAGHTHRATALTDALATAVATFLAFWTVASGAVHGGEDLPHALIMATYPAMDTLLLSLSTHLAIQRRNIPTSLWWLIGTLTAVTALDATLSTYELIAPSDTPAILDSLQAFTVFGMAVVVIH
ncbi:hypothetical protein GZ204_05605, partial [Dermatophilus congolensis]